MPALNLSRGSLARRREPSKAQLKERQWQVCRDYLGRFADVAAAFPVEEAVERARTTGGREVAPESRTVDLLRTRFARTIEFTRAHAPRAFDADAAVLDAGAADAVYLRAVGYWAEGVDATAAELRASAHFHHVFELSLEDFGAMVTHAGWRLRASEPLIPFEAMPKWWLVALEHEEDA